ncbi:site-specific integrase [Gluconacetobacter liquefaciens]|nr:site-specific integrase [Gluconacetobacter liquefaciens]RDI38127.1 site-specific recombinase XerC [Gluconacetobacter liquefaciens]
MRRQPTDLGTRLVQVRPRLLSAKDSALYLSISQSTFMSIVAPAIREIRITPKRKSFLIEDLDKWVDELRDKEVSHVRLSFRHQRLPQGPLPATNSPEFWAAFRAELGQQAQTEERTRRATDTLTALIEDWLRSAKFQQLKAPTQTNYRRILMRMQAEDYAMHLLAHFEPQHIRRFVARRASTPAAANHWLRLFRLLFDFAVADGRVQSDPTLGVKRLKEKAAGAKSWTEDEIARYEARWPSGSIQRMALALLLYTGQRRSDVVAMGRAHIGDGLLAVQQVKTGASLLIPIHPALAVEIGRSDPAKGTFLDTVQGNPSSPVGFYNRFAGWVKAAGLPAGLSPHGLRKAAARRLAEAGCTAHQIAAITGHKTLAEVQRYTLAVDQERLAREAMAKIGQRCPQNRS